MSSTGHLSPVAVLGEYGQRARLFGERLGAGIGVKEQMCDTIEDYCLLYTNQVRRKRGESIEEVGNF